MKQYIKPEIKIRHIQAQEVILAASLGTEETTTLQIFNNQTIDNDKALAKPHMMSWDDEEDE